MSNGKWIYVIFMILVITSHTQTDNDTTTDELQKLKHYQPSKDEICNKVIVGAIDTTKSLIPYVVALGRTKKRVLLITKDLYVYDAPADSFDSTRNTVYFKYIPIPMKDKYPVLFHNSIFQSIKNEISACITYDSEGDWICMATNNSEQAINYNIDTSEVHKGFVLSGKGPEILIATNEPCKFYSLQRREDKENTITGSRTALWLTAYKCKNGDRIVKSDEIEKVRDFRMLCYDSDNVDIRMIDGKKCDSDMAVEWPIGAGFVIDGKFVLIGTSSNYVFSENIFTQKGKKFAVNMIDKRDFYNCAGIIPPNKVIFKSYFYWIIAAIILLMVLLAIIISSVYVAHRSLANKKKTRSGLERSSKISLSKSSIKVASKRSVKSKSKSKTSRIKSSSPKNTSKSGRVGSRTSLSGILRKATSPGSRKSLSGRLKKTISLGSRTSLLRRSRKATSPGSRTSLSGRSRKATSPGSRTSLKGRSARPTSPMSKMSSKISLNRLKRSKSRLNSISRGGSTSKLASLIKNIS
ncbi:uncharacterized protein LOC113794413 [Dermatophagoides pteronyssinus]|uniref:uncharacterized protein LOC113794413 n=1 Tax=Dermatophagoides pteronyssinus TaxID=6956 RepID=UPI003F679747